MRSVALLMLLVGALVRVGEVHANEVQPPFSVREVVDLPITLAAGTLWLVTELEVRDEFATPFESADYARIGSVDRSAVGFWNPDLHRASDVLLIGAFLTPFLFNGIDHAIWGKERSKIGRWIWSDLVIVLEAVAITGALTNMAKCAFTRYRPYTYIATNDPEAYDAIQQDEDLRTSLQEATEAPGSALSFWSGHTALAFTALCASATLLTYKHHDRHPGPLFAMWGGTIGAGVVMSVLRVRSGMHFPTDVLVGAAIGAAIGIVVPSLHVNHKLRDVAITPLAVREGGGVAVYARW